MTSGKRKVKSKAVQAEKTVKEKPLTKKEARSYRIILEERLKQAELVIDRVIPRTMASDPADMAQQEIEVIHNLQAREIASREIRRIKQALQRMDKGEFGICEDCGEQIPRSRLNCQPDAACCIECTRAREKKAQRLRFRGGSLNYREI